MKSVRDWNTEDATRFLRSKNLVEEYTHVNKFEIAGAGNMNCTMRAQTEVKNFIIKQSSPYCEKYPQIPAPIERLKEEYFFYTLTQNNPNLLSSVPKMYCFDLERYILVMEDLGYASDYSFLYAREREIDLKDLEKVTSILVELHKTKLPESEEFYNRPMRLLNHEHIFDIPLRRNPEIDLDNIVHGLDAVASKLKKDMPFTHRVHELGGLYLAAGNRLVHGDYYPNSWIKTDKGIFVIDPEFGFQGLAEFDVGVMLAHLILSQQSTSALECFITNYDFTICDKQIAIQFAGVEVMRRLLGVAQLPLEYDLKERTELLDHARTMVLDGEI
ncbi:MAG: phosphotransferase [Halobacteriovoraceae bacterium]|nr:phosphotransferase [Halobacteriovoraceae bacterium]MCB9095595.1 phosphotransferase [Halobacteriovoraceae bacterium]